MMQQIIDEQLDLHSTEIPVTRQVISKLTKEGKKELIQLVLEANNLGLEGDELLGYLNENKS